MSEYREQCPLLPDELSDDDQFLPRQHRRRSFTRKHRLKASLRGATAILKRWPDHWTTFVTYWWIGVGMLSLTTFIIYNSFVSLSVIPKPYLKPVVQENSEINLYNTDQLDTKKSVCMHLFSSTYTEMDLKRITHHIKLLTEKFPLYTYRLIIVLNDTNSSDNHIGDEENNEIAMNALWVNNIFTYDEMYKNANIQVEYISLCRYLDRTVISKFWRELSVDFIRFMVRIISVWDRGGIAFNPIILTGESSEIYKLLKVLSTYQKKKNKMEHETKSIKHKIINETNRHKKPKVNNIQDIINALENNDQENNTSQEQLDGMENKNDYVVENKNFTEETLPQAFTATSLQSDILDSSSKSKAKTKWENRHSNENEELSKQNHTEDFASTTVSLLPKFLNFLFHRTTDLQEDKSKNIKQEDNSTTVSPTRALNKETEVVPTYEFSTKENLKNSDEYYEKKSFPSNDESYRMTIDLKGNIIASNTVCHAFIGYLFNDVIKYRDFRNLTDFLVSELTSFCHGPCTDIDVILL